MSTPFCLCIPASFANDVRRTSRLQPSNTLLTKYLLLCLRILIVHLHNTGCGYTIHYMISIFNVKGQLILCVVIYGCSCSYCVSTFYLLTLLTYLFSVVCCSLCILIHQSPSSGLSGPPQFFFFICDEVLNGAVMYWEKKVMVPHWLDPLL